DSFSQIALLFAQRPLIAVRLLTTSKMRFLAFFISIPAMGFTEKGKAFLIKLGFPRCCNRFRAFLKLRLLVDSLPLYAIGLLERGLLRISLGRSENGVFREP